MQSRYNGRKNNRESDLDDDEQSVFYLYELIQLVEVCIVKPTAFVFLFFPFLFKTITFWNFFHVAFVIKSCQSCFKPFFSFQMHDVVDEIYFLSGVLCPHFPFFLCLKYKTLKLGSGAKIPVHHWREQEPVKSSERNC